jgi:hypothetical protein
MVVQESPSGRKYQGNHRKRITFNFRKVVKARKDGKDFELIFGHHESVFVMTPSWCTLEARYVYDLIMEDGTELFDLDRDDFRWD